MYGRDPQRLLVTLGSTWREGHEVGRRRVALPLCPLGALASTELCAPTSTGSHGVRAFGPSKWEGEVRTRAPSSTRTSDPRFEAGLWTSMKADVLPTTPRARTTDTLPASRPVGERFEDILRSTLSVTLRKRLRLNAATVSVHVGLCAGTARAESGCPHAARPAAQSRRDPARKAAGSFGW